MNIRAVESGENRRTRPSTAQQEKSWGEFQANVVAEKSLLGKEKRKKSQRWHRKKVFFEKKSIRCFPEME